MQLRAAALLLALRAAAAAERLRGRDGRDLFSPKAPRGPRGSPPAGPDLATLGIVGGDDGPVNVADEDCATEFPHSYTATDVTVVDETIAKVGATGLQLNLAGTVLATGTALRLRGADGTVVVTAAALADNLNGWSPVVGGSRVKVELDMDDKAAALGLTSTVKISGFKAEGVCDPQAASICGATDDRVLSEDQRQGRIGGCTGWLISEDIFIQAGHCGTPGSSTRLHLGVQNANNAPPSMQFAVEQGTYEGVNGGVGNDWGVGRLLPNGQTGLKAGQSNGGLWYDLGDVPSGTAGNVIIITGYGVADTQSRWQKTHEGDLVGIGGASLSYVPDTTGGNSGSPVVLKSTGQAIGVHTHGGCSETGGSNTGTRIDQSAFAAKIDAMLNPTPPAPTPAPTPCTAGADVKVVVQTDNYGSETTWELKDTCTDTVVGSSSGLDSNQQYEDEYCVAPGKFEFTINDSYGDGICCSYGEGSYKLYLNGNLEHDGGDFGTSETKEFGSCDATPPPTAATPPPTAATPPPTAATPPPTAATPPPTAATPPPTAATPPPTAATPPPTAATPPPTAATPPPTAATPPPTAATPPPTAATPPPTAATPPPTAAATSPPTAAVPAPTPPADGVITVDLFQVQFTFTPTDACVVAPVGGATGGSPHQCAQACAVLADCEGFETLGDECFLVDGAPDDCGSDAPNGAFYDRDATMYFDS